MTWYARFKFEKERTNELTFAATAASQLRIAEGWSLMDDYQINVPFQADGSFKISDLNIRKTWAAWTTVPTQRSKVAWWLMPWYRGVGTLDEVALA